MWQELRRASLHAECMAQGTGGQEDIWRILFQLVTPKDFSSLYLSRSLGVGSVQSLQSP